MVGSAGCCPSYLQDKKAPGVHLPSAYLHTIGQNGDALRGVKDEGGGEDEDDEGGAA